MCESGQVFGALACFFESVACKLFQRIPTLFGHAISACGESLEATSFEKLSLAPQDKDIEMREDEERLCHGAMSNGECARHISAAWCVDMDFGESRSLSLLAATQTYTQKNRTVGFGGT